MRHRAMRLDVRISRQAMKVVLPTNRQIGPWQIRAAHLNVLAEKLRAKGRVDQSVADEARSLLDEVEGHRRRILDQIEQLPPQVASSTRLEDTVRALASVAAVLERTLALNPPAGVRPAGSRQRPADRAGQPAPLRP